MANEAIPLTDMERMYAELRKVAAFHLKGPAPKANLQPTAPVNETWLRPARHHWKSRSHFMSVASTTMRGVLVDCVRRRLAGKRGGKWTRVSIDEGSDPVSACPAICPPSAAL